MGVDHDAYGRARHPFMTGSGGWAYFSATRYMLGIRPQFDSMEIDPCIPAQWDGFKLTRVWKGTEYQITVENPDHVMAGIKEVYIDGEAVKPEASKAGLVKEDDHTGESANRMTAQIPYMDDHKTHNIKLIMG